MKQKRHTAILDLITARDIATQEELAALLRADGFNVTQATVSRDIKELQLTKTPTGTGVYKYALPQNGEDAPASKRLSILCRSVCGVDYAKNMVVIKTQSGMAQAAAVVLDELSLKESVGSIGGDDTIFCVTRTEEDALKLMERVKNLVMNQ